ncbi:MAG: sigma-70 family RNA polymerase sigma factor [Hyphomonadaceae bacterium]
MASDGPLSAADRAGLLRYLVRRTRDRELSEDLAQDVMVRLIAFMARERVEKPRALAFRIADNLMINAFRRRRIRGEVALVEDVGAPPAEEDLKAREDQRLAALREAIERLPPKRREVLIRRRLRGQSHREIAEAMGLSAAAVEKHVVRAMASLRADLDDLLRKELRE